MMKHLTKILYASVTAMTLAACAPAPSDTPTPSATSTRTPTPTATSTATPIPPTPTDAPIPTPELVFRDDFEEVLQEGWAWIREVKDHWSLTETPGFLRITLQRGNYPRNLLLREAPEPPYRIVTYLHFEPTRNFQIASLTAYEDDANRLSFGRAFCNVQGACVGNGLYFDNTEGGFLKGSNFATQSAGPGGVFLRLTREGFVYTAEFSLDGQKWILVGRHQADLRDEQIGLMAAQGPGPTAAEFDFFEVYLMP